MISSRYGYPVASPGSMLRREKQSGTDLGVAAEKLTARGDLLPDTTIVELVCRWLADRSEFVFDGFPRTVGQAKALDQLLDARQTALDLVIALEATLETLRARVSNRLVCLNCGEIVSLHLHVPNVSAPCPKCGGKLGKRSDDTPETLTRRMREYKDKTEPLLGFYEEQCLLCRVDSVDTPERVFASIAHFIEAP